METAAVIIWFVAALTNGFNCGLAVREENWHAAIGWGVAVLCSIAAYVGATQ